MNIFEPFIIHDGMVSLSDNIPTSVPIKIIRDTGASQSLILSNILPFSSESATGASVLICDIN